jgi:exodeoxyribonuclease V beta subunit
MRGEIDLFFRKNGKYYVLDWKTNYLGASPEDYSPEKIRKDMARHLYVLQALIYVFAAHLFLKTRSPKYDYDRDFGGYAYVYVRGVDGKGNGAYSGKPPKSLMEDMERVLLEGGGL